MNELTDDQIRRQDFVDNAIHDLLQHLNLSKQDISWNIEIIADIRDRILFWFVEHHGLTDEMTFYPYIEA